MKIQHFNQHQPTFHRRGRSIYLIIICIAALLLLGFLLYAFQPSQQLLPNLPITPIPIFFSLLFIFLFTGVSYAVNNKAHGLVAGLFAVLCFTFLLLNLRHPFFFILLFAFFLMCDLFISYRK
jgi:hypothetical protein